MEGKLFIKKVINNNVVLVTDEKGTEVVIMGKGAVLTWFPPQQARCQNGMDLSMWIWMMKEMEPR